MGMTPLRISATPVGRWAAVAMLYVLAWGIVAVTDLRDTQGLAAVAVVLVSGVTAGWALGNLTALVLAPIPMAVILATESCSSGCATAGERAVSIVALVAVATISLAVGIVLGRVKRQRESGT